MKRAPSLEIESVLASYADRDITWTDANRLINQIASEDSQLLYSAHQRLERLRQQKGRE